MTEVFVVVKHVLAMAMSRLEYNEYRGWDLPKDEEGSDPGYLIEDLDANSNHPDHKGYVSWVPKDQFDRTYRASGNMSFGQALESLRSGQRVAREGWNGKGQWLSYVGNGSYDVSCSAVGYTPADAATTTVKLRPWVGIKTVGSEYIPWAPSQSDMLAEDWIVVWSKV